MTGLPALLKAVARRRLVVIGDAMLDNYEWGDATRISPEAPVPVVHVARETRTAGGAANVAGNVAALGASVELIAAIGRDKNGEALRAELHRRRIGFDDRFLLPKGRGATITKTRVIVRNQQLCRLDHEDGPDVYRRVFSPAAWRLAEAKIAQADGVILSDYAKGVLTDGSILRLAALARKRGKFVALDPKPSNHSPYDDLDLLTPNRTEALELSELKFGAGGRLDFDRIRRAIWSRYHPRNLVITLGPDGMLISERGGPAKAIPTAARQVYDVSGAGDTVIAALVLALTSGAGLERAAHFANAAAGVVVGKVGTATATPAELLAYCRAS